MAIETVWKSITIILILVECVNVHQLDQRNESSTIILPYNVLFNCYDDFGNEWIFFNVLLEELPILVENQEQFLKTRTILKK